MSGWAFLILFIFLKVSVSFAQSSEKSWSEAKWEGTPVLSSSVWKRPLSEVPEGIDAGTSKEKALRRMAGDQIKSVLGIEKWQDTFWVRRAKKAEQRMKKEISYLGSGRRDHSWSFRVLVSQAVASLKYSGWGKAEIKLSALQKEIAFQLQEKIFHNRNIVVSQTRSPIENRFHIGMSWGF